MEAYSYSQDFPVLTLHASRSRLTRQHGHRHLHAQLGESIAEGTVVKWLVPVGGLIEKDQSLLEVETEKVALEIPRRQLVC